MKEELGKYHKMLDGIQDISHDDELMKFMDQASSVKIPRAGRSKEDIWRKIDSQTGEKKNIPLGYLSVAASLVILITATFLFYLKKPGLEEIVASSGEHTTHILPDGSSVALNASSKITYDLNWDREVTLQGEAFFEVKKGSTFMVHTPLGIVSVLGTSFNVSVREASLVVQCKTGKVQVQIPESDFKTILEPGDKLEKIGEKVSESSYDEHKMGLWQAGEYYFEEKPVAQVFEELERQFSLTIDSELDTESTLFSGYFISESVNLALEMVCLPLDLTYEFTSDTTVMVKAAP